MLFHTTLRALACSGVSVTTGIRPDPKPFAEAHTPTTLSGRHAAVRILAAAGAEDTLAVAVVHAAQNAADYHERVHDTFEQ